MRLTISSTLIPFAPNFVLYWTKDIPSSGKNKSIAFDLRGCAGVLLRMGAVQGAPGGQHFGSGFVKVREVWFALSAVYMLAPFDTSYSFPRTKCLSLQSLLFQILLHSAPSTSPFASQV